MLIIHSERWEVVKDLMKTWSRRLRRVFSDDSTTPTRDRLDRSTRLSTYPSTRLQQSTIDSIDSGVYAIPAAVWVCLFGPRIRLSRRIQVVSTCKCCIICHERRRSPRPPWAPLLIFKSDTYSLFWAWLNCNVLEPLTWMLRKISINLKLQKACNCSIVGCVRKTAPQLTRSARSFQLLKTPESSRHFLDIA